MTTTLLLLPLQLAADASSIDLTVFAQYGVLGIIAALLIWFAKGAHQRERERADRMEEKYEQLIEKMLPALTSATRAVEESTELLRSIQRERERDMPRGRRSSVKGDDV